jgi:hypothetical protein
MDTASQYTENKEQRAYFNHNSSFSCERLKFVYVTFSKKNILVATINKNNFFQKNISESQYCWLAMP